MASIAFMVLGYTIGFVVGMHHDKLKYEISRLKAALDISKKFIGGIACLCSYRGLNLFKCQRCKTLDQIKEVEAE